MALSAQAALLDELMGKNRNAAPGEAVKDCHFTDPDVCKHFLCGFCPHELFVNTRADLGPCDKIHDDNLKRQYEKSSRRGRLGYEEDFEQLLRSLLADVEKRIKKGRDRLSLTQGSDDKYSSARQERINALNEQINTLISEADQLGREGSVDAAKEALEKCERLKIERLDLETRHTGENAKAMEVCNVCGSFLIVGDAQCRVEEHITGKQHVGFAKIRSTIEQLRANRQKAMEDRLKARETDKTRHLSDVRKSPEKRTSRHRSGSRSSRHRRREGHHGNDKSPSHRHHRHRQESRHRSKTGGNGSRVSPRGERRSRRKSNSECTAAQKENHHFSKPASTSKVDESEVVRRKNRQTTKSRSRSASNRRRKERGKSKDAPSVASPPNDYSREADKPTVRRTSVTRPKSDDASASTKSTHKKRHSKDKDHQRSRRRRSESRDEDMENSSGASKRRSSRDKTSSKHRRRLSPPEKKKSTGHYKSPEKQRGKNSKIRHSSSSGSSGGSRSSSTSESDASSSRSSHGRRRPRKEPQRKTRKNSSSSSSSDGRSTSVDKSE